MKISKETKERLDSLDLAGKGKTYDMILNDLLTFYEKARKSYTRDRKDWKRAMEEYRRNVEAYNKTRESYEVWENLLKWARSKGFKY